MDGFQLLRPLWLLAALPVAVALWHLVRSEPAGTVWKRLVDRHLLPHLLTANKRGKDYRTLVTVTIAWLLAVLALAGPSWQRLPPVQFQPRVPPLMILLDLSRSMHTRDLYPSRIDVARAKLRTLVRRLPQRPVSLIVYALTAHSVMPFTEDRALIDEVLAVLSPELMPAQGSRASAALKLAREALVRQGIKDADLLLVGDTADQASPALAEDLSHAGMRLSVWGVGTMHGGLIPDVERSYLVTATGTVRSRLDVGSLQQLAARGTGRFQRVSRDDTDIDALIRAFGTADRFDTRIQDGTLDTWRDGGPWLIFALLPLALLLFRPGLLPVLILSICLCGTPMEVMAWQWLWKNNDQRALAYLEQQDYARAIQDFRDPMWRGIALYRNGDYLAAATAFAGLDSAIARYNLGNALTGLGRLEEAVAAYRLALLQNPGLSDAAFNRDLLLQLIRNRDTGIEEAPHSAPSLPAPRPKEGTTTASTTAEELLGAPNLEDFKHKQSDSAPDPDTAGKSGGGAMLYRSVDRSLADESGTVGEGLDAGTAAERPEDQVARRGKESTGEQAGQHKRIAPRHPAPDESAVPTRKEEASVGLEQQDDSMSAGKHSGGQSAQATRDTRHRPTVPMGRQEQGTAGGHQTESLSSQEAAQAMAVWLDGIENNPGELLKERFKREYQRGPQPTDPAEPW